MHSETMDLVKRLQYAIELESAAYPFDRDKQACHAIGAVVSILRAVRAENDAEALPVKEDMSAQSLPKTLPSVGIDAQTKVDKLRELISPETFEAINKHLERKANANPTK